MSKGLRNISFGRDEVIRRRLTQNIKGLGYWAAFDAQNNKRIEQEKEAERKAKANG